MMMGLKEETMMMKISNHLPCLLLLLLLLLLWLLLLLRLL